MTPEPNPEPDNPVTLEPDPETDDADRQHIFLSLVRLRDMRAYVEPEAAERAVAALVDYAWDDELRSYIECIEEDLDEDAAVEHARQTIRRADAQAARAADAGPKVMDWHDLMRPSAVLVDAPRPTVRGGPERQAKAVEAATVLRGNAALLEEAARYVESDDADLAVKNVAMVQFGLGTIGKDLDGLVQ